MEPTRKSMLARQPGGRRNENFAIVVESYDTKSTPNTVTGKRVDNGDVVRVHLRDIDYTPSGSNLRSEIKDFAAPRRDRQHPGTVVGGTLLIQDGIPTGEKAFSARWIQPLSHKPGEAEVFVATVHVNPVRYGKKTPQYPNGKPYSMMTVLHDAKFDTLSDEMMAKLGLAECFVVNNTDELRGTALEMLDNNVGVGVRIIAPDGADSAYVGRNTGQSNVDAVDAFMKMFEPVAADINSGKVICEIVPYTSIFAGKKTMDVMTTNRPMMARVAQFNMEEMRDNRKRNTLLFRPAIVAVRFTDAAEDGSKGVYFTHFEPLLNVPPVASLNDAIYYAQTEQMAPQRPKFDFSRRNGAAAPEQAAGQSGIPSDGPDSGFGSFDAGDTPGGSSDDDLVGAAQARGFGPDDLDDDFPPQQQEVAQQESKPAARGRFPARGR